MRDLRGTGRTLRRFIACQRGATAIEYCLIATGIALAVIATVRGIGTALHDNFYTPVESATKN